MMKISFDRVCLYRDLTVIPFPPPPLSRRASNHTTATDHQTHNRTHEELHPNRHNSDNPLFLAVHPLLDKLSLEGLSPRMLA